MNRLLRMNRPLALIMMIALLMPALNRPAVAQRRFNGNQDQANQDRQRGRQNQWNQNQWNQNQWDQRSGGRRTSRSGSGPSAFEDEFGVLSEHNIFLRDRRRREEQPRTNRTYTPPTPEQTYVLTGIVFEDGEHRAYFEDITRGAVLKVSPGDAIARGKVGQVRIDAVEYLAGDGGQTWVSAGSNLTGAQVASVSDVRVGAAAAMSNADSADLSIEERMRMRRMQESMPGGGMLLSPGALPQQNRGDDGDDDDGGNFGQGFGQQNNDDDDEDDNGGPRQFFRQDDDDNQGQAQQQAVPAPALSGAENLTIEEQMRQRRQQEVGR